MLRAKRCGLALTDLVIGLAILAMMLGLGIRWIGQNGSRSNRAKCVSNLSLIGKGILIYANDNRGNYPRTPGGLGQTDLSFDGAASPDPFVEGAVPRNCLPASYFLLVREDLSPSVFVCPETDDTPDPLAGAPANRRSNFSGPQHLSYSFATPFPADPSTGYKLTSSMNPQFAVAADKNSGDPALRGLSPASPKEQMEKANSRNHYGEGQNVLYADGHAEWWPNPLCGVNGDNIYTSGNTVLFGSPTSMNDSVLLPVSNAPFRSGGLAGGTLLWVLIGVVLVGGIAALVFFLSRSKTPLAPVGPPAPPPLPPGVA